MDIMNGCLQQLAQLWDAVPPLLALIGHCVYCTNTVPELRGNFLAHFCMAYLTAFGGGMVTSLLLMRPDKASVGLVANPVVSLTFVLCWWVINYAPYDVARQLLSRVWPLKTLAKLCWAWSRSRNIVGRVRLACELYPGSPAGPLVLGTLMACGGRMVTDTVRLSQGRLKAAQHELLLPSYTWRSAFCSTCLYYFACHFPATRFLGPAEGRAALTTLLVAHAALPEAVGQALDWTKPLLGVVLTLLNIPIPWAADSAPAPRLASTKHLQLQASRAEASSVQRQQQPRPGQQQQPRQQQTGQQQPGQQQPGQLPQGVRQRVGHTASRPSR